MGGVENIVLSAEFALTTDPNASPPDPNLTAPTVLIRHVALLLVNGTVEAAHHVRTAGEHRADSGFTFDPNQGTWKAQASIPDPPGGTAEILVINGQFGDPDMDLNNDGRFNQPDVDALPSVFGAFDRNDLDPNNPNSLPGILDFDVDGDIDAADQAVMQAIVDWGLDSGIFADFNNDGIANCSDAVDEATYLNVALDDARYDPALDRDLDGVITQEDLGWVQRTVLPGDTDADNDVDVTDLAVVLNANGTCVGNASYNVFADINQDGCVNISDLSIVLANFGASCP